MAVNISVWGSSGSGKGVFSLALAHELSHQKKNVVIISADRTSPMFSSFLPHMNFENENSLGKLLSSEVNTENLKRKLHTNKNNKYVAFLSLGTFDSFQKYKENWDTKKIDSLMYILNNFADYVIFDTNSNFITDNFSLYALQNSEKVFTIYNCENKSTDFYITYQTLLENDKRYDTENYISVLNNYFEYSPYEKYSKDFGMQYKLPHAMDVYMNYLGGEGNILSVSEKQSIFFKREIEKIVKENLIE